MNAFAQEMLCERGVCGSIDQLHGDTEHERVVLR
jgi:hypothetical protein